MRQAREDAGIKVAARIEGRPAGADDVPGMHNGRGEPLAARLPQQIRLYRRLLDPIVAEGAARLVLGGRHLYARSMDPDGAAVQEVLHLAPQRLDDLLGARDLEADQV